jgi:hypothetical protein
MSQQEVRRQEPEVRMDAPRRPARTFQDLVVWRNAHEFMLAV